jgi:hypothetical protein
LCHPTIGYNRDENRIKRSELGISSFVLPRQSTRGSREGSKGWNLDWNDTLRISDFDSRLTLVAFHWHRLLAN